MRENAVETSLNSCERAARPGAKARHELIDASKREDAEAGPGQSDAGAKVKPKSGVSYHCPISKTAGR